MLLNLELLFLTISVIGSILWIIIALLVDVIRFRLSPYAKPLNEKIEGLNKPTMGQLLDTVTLDPLMLEFASKPCLWKDINSFVRLVLKVNFKLSILGCVVFFILGM